MWLTYPEQMSTVWLLVARDNCVDPQDDLSWSWSTRWLFLWVYITTTSLCTSWFILWLVDPQDEFSCESVFFHSGFYLDSRPKWIVSPQLRTSILGSVVGGLWEVSCWLSTGLQVWAVDIGVSSCQRALEGSSLGLAVIWRNVGSAEMASEVELLREPQV